MGPGPQGKRWPKWKQRRDNSSQDVTDENRKKKLHHGIKCIRKALKKARTFEERKIQRRFAQASAGAAAGKKKAATTAVDDANKGGGGGGGGGGVVDAEKLKQQLAAVRAIDLEALGAYMGTATYDAVLASKDAPTADKALPTDGALETETAEKAVGPAATKVAGVQPALVVARRLLGASCVREEVTALQEKLVLVGDRQEWAKGRLAREELRRLAKEEHKAAKEAEEEEGRKNKAEAKARTTNNGPGDVDAAARRDDEEEEEEDGGGGGGGGDGDLEEEEEEEEWSSGGEDNSRPDDVSDSEGEDSDSDDIVIRDDQGELEKFLADEENGGSQDGDDDDGDDDDGDGDGDGVDVGDGFERDNDSDVDPDDELPPELAKILGVDKKPGKNARGGRGREAGGEGKKGVKKEPAPLPPAAKKPKKRMGQRARRLLAEQVYGTNANHIKMERDEKERQERQKREQEENMHPAWAAKRAAAAALAAAPKGAKVTFGDDGALDGGGGGGRGDQGGRGGRGPMQSVPLPPSGRGGGGRMGGGGGRGGRDGGRGGRGGDGGRGGGGRGDGRKETPKKARAQRPPKVYIGEIKGGTGEVVGKVTKPMGPSGSKEDAKGDQHIPHAAGAGASKGGRRGGGYNAEEAAAAHPAWAAKRKAANQAWGNVKPSGKKVKFDD